MTGTVPVLSMIFMAISCIAAFAIPIGLFLFLYLKKRADILPFFVGCGVMLLFAFVLESAVHGIVLGSAAGEKIRNNMWLYALYGGLMAGLFEETGRLTAFKTILRGKRDKDVNALMYGAGHGGFEAIAIIGFSMISNLALSVMINSGSFSALAQSVPKEAFAQLEAGAETLITTPSYLFLMGIIERVFAVTLQIALSVFVWFAAKNRNRWYLFPAAILIHFAVDALTVILSQIGIPVPALEAVVGVMSVLAAAAAKAVWKMETARNRIAGNVAE